MATIVDTGTTTRQLRGGEWVDVSVVIRNGVTCACGDLHGLLPRCIGSAASTPAPKRRAKSAPKTDHPQAAVAQEFFPIGTHRLPRAIPQATIDACADCGPQHEAFYYCEAHRSQAVRNVILASRKNGGIISLHMMMARNGLDIVS